VVQKTTKKGMHGDKMDVNDKVQQKRDQEVTILVEMKERKTPKNRRRTAHS
jgi:hypothetical protein